jgi:uncharacterized protein YceK
MRSVTVAMRSVVVALATAFVIGGCSIIGSAGASAVTGTVTYLPRIALADRARAGCGDQGRAP